jgi:hypothetical protein
MNEHKFLDVHAAIVTTQGIQAKKGNAVGFVFSITELAIYVLEYLDVLTLLHI